MTKATRKNQKGFTLIELLVVMGILAVLLAIVLIAINPARQFAQAQNRKRQSDVSAILNAFGAYAADNKGVLPADITTTAADISKTDCQSLVPTYISALPSDPSVATWAACGDATGYTVQLVGTRLQVNAPAAVAPDAPISVIR